MGFLKKLFYSLHPFPPSLHQLRLHILQPLPPHRCRLKLPQHMAHTQRLNPSPFSPCLFPQNEVRLSRKIPVFLYSTEQCSAADRTGPFQEQGSRAVHSPVPDLCTELLTPTPLPMHSTSPWGTAMLPVCSMHNRSSEKFLLLSYFYALTW